MYNLFIGCDMSKDFFDVSYYDVEQPIYLGQFENNKQGFKKMQTGLLKTGVPQHEWFICFENTGPYSKQFLYWLLGQQITCREESALQISMSSGLKRGKNDKADSKAICLYTYEKRERLTPSKKPSKDIEAIKKLLSVREMLIKQKIALVNSFKSHNITSSDVNKLLRSQHEESMDLINTQLKAIETEIKSILKKDKMLKQNYGLIKSVYGVGPIIAAYVIAYTNNFESIKDPRKFACLIGAAPFDHRSGKYIGKTRTSPFGHRKIKAVFSNGALQAIRWDKQISHYCKRKTDQGKPYGLIINNVINKIIHRIFAVVKRGTPYIKLGF